MVNYKQAILVRTDLDMGKGKIAAQVGHACVESIFRAPDKLVSAWRKEGMAKIVCRVAKLDDLYKYKMVAEELGITTSLISDGGHTQVEPGTVTCIALGPAEDTKIDAVIGTLKLL